VLQIAANRRVPAHAGPIRVDELAATAPATAWQTADGLTRHPNRDEERPAANSINSVASADRRVQHEMYGIPAMAADPDPPS
jgi:hypothetical protein